MLHPRDAGHTFRWNADGVGEEVAQVSLTDIQAPRCKRSGRVLAARFRGIA
jgi:hypothetical protein